MTADNNWMCPFCGQTNAANATYCQNCGTERPASSPAVPPVPASVSASAFEVPASCPVPPPIGQPSKGNEELLIAYARFIKGFTILLCILGVIGCIVSIAEDEAWVIAVIVPGVTILALPLFLMAAAIRVYCNMSLNLYRIDENLQKIVRSKNL